MSIGVVVAVVVPIAALAGVPAVVLWLLGRAFGALATCEPRRGRTSGQPALSIAPPIEQLSADLRRLSAELTRLDRCEVPEKGARVLAATLAYDDVLLATCAALEVPAPTLPRLRSPLPAPQRLDLETGLARAGLVW